jgi:hypothetical protein
MGCSAGSKTLRCILFYGKRVDGLFSISRPPAYIGKTKKLAESI